MTTTEIVAYIGAAAWLPPIVYWLHNWLVKPIVRIVPEARVELGFTTLGPIFNIRLALSASSKDAVVERMWIELQHESGETRELAWTGMREMFSEITDAAGNRQLVERDQPAIALKLSTITLTEKLIRFHDTKFQETQRPLQDALSAQAAFLNGETDAHDNLLKSKELFNLLESFKSAFWWKCGSYRVRFCIEGRDQAKVDAQIWKFHMSQLDVDLLRNNLGLIGVEMVNAVKSHLPEFQPEPVSWAWRNISLSRCDT